MKTPAHLAGVFLFGFLRLGATLLSRSRFGRGCGGVFNSLSNSASRRSCCSFLDWLSPMPKYESPLSLSDEHMRLIGIIAAHWEAIDITLQQALAEVMELEFDRVALLIRHIGFGNKINLLMIYARRAFQEEGHMELCAHSDAKRPLIPIQSGH